MTPVPAPVGTVTVSWVAVAALTVAEIPLKVTRSLPAVVLKLVPVIVTVVLWAPESGDTVVMVGVEGPVGPVGPVGPKGPDGLPDLLQSVATSARSTVKKPRFFRISMAVFLAFVKVSRMLPAFRRTHWAAGIGM